MVPIVPAPAQGHKQIKIHVYSNRSYASIFCKKGFIQRPGKESPASVLSYLRGRAFLTNFKFCDIFKTEEFTLLVVS